jgi:hypothetical protein
MHAPDELSLFVARLESIGAPYMVTGATAAILYGQPRVTNDLDVVLSLNDVTRAALLQAFPESEFYVPPESVIRAEEARPQRGHFNLIHHDSGFKADVYLTGSDPLHAWAMPLRRRMTWNETLSIAVAPPEYVILRKMEFYREGGSSKHPADIRAILEVSGIDEAIFLPWVKDRGLADIWGKVRL